MTPDMLDRLREAQASGQAAVLVKRLEDGRSGLMVDGSLVLGDAWPTALDDALLAAVRTDRSAKVETAGETWFVQVFNPPLRLVVVGAVHIAQALVPMARIAGYAVTVIDPRQAFATADRFPDVTLHTDWPDEVLPELALDHRCAVVTLTHDPKIDDPALAAALATPAFYISALGSRKTHSARLERLRDEGLGEGELERIHGPAGLPLGAVTPAEIAVSVMAQMTAVLRRTEPPAASATP